MRRSIKIITMQQANVYKTEKSSQGRVQLLPECRTGSAERLEDDPGLECRNR